MRRGYCAFLAALILWSCGEANVPRDTKEPEKLAGVETYGCRSGDSAPATVTESAYDVLCGSCLAYCHVGHPAAGGMNLEPRNVVTQTVEAPATQAPHLFRISPGKAEDSYLIHKVRGTHLEAGGKGQRMPAAGAKLDAVEERALTEWIQSLPVRGE